MKRPRKKELASSVDGVRLIPQAVVKETLEQFKAACQSILTDAWTFENHTLLLNGELIKHKIRTDFKAQAMRALYNASARGDASGFARLAQTLAALGYGKELGLTGPQAHIGGQTFVFLAGKGPDEWLKAKILEDGSAAVDVVTTPGGSRIAH